MFFIEVFGRNGLTLNEVEMAAGPGCLVLPNASTIIVQHFEMQFDAPPDVLPPKKTGSEH